MDLPDLKRRLIYTVVANSVTVDSDVTAYGKTKKEARLRYFEHICDTADALRRSYGERLENYK